MRHRAYGVLIESEVELPELASAAHPDGGRPAEPDRPDWIVRVVDRLTVPARAAWFDQVGEPEPWLFVTAAGDEAVLRFSAGQAFAIDRRRRVIGVLRSGRPDDPDTRHLLTSQVIPRAISGTTIAERAPSLLSTARVAASAPERASGETSAYSAATPASLTAPGSGGEACRSSSASAAFPGSAWATER